MIALAILAHLTFVTPQDFIIVQYHQPYASRWYGSRRGDYQRKRSCKAYGWCK